MHSLASCSPGKGEFRDRNLEEALSERLDSIADFRYVGMSDVRRLDRGRLQAVIIYYVSDSAGNRIERNARVVTNEDCSEIHTWEETDSHILDDTKQIVKYKFEEKGLDLDGSLIDALIELKKR